MMKCVTHIQRILTQHFQEIIYDLYANFICSDLTAKMKGLFGKRIERHCQVAGSRLRLLLPDSALYFVKYEYNEGQEMLDSFYFYSFVNILSKPLTSWSGITVVQLTTISVVKELPPSV
jgi:hypothetical protein